MEAPALGSSRVAQHGRDRIREPRVTDLVAVGLVSGAAIAAQVALTRVMSITLWHHFAYLVIGVALLGFGVAGAWLTARGGALRDDDGPADAVLARRARWAAGWSFAAVLTALIIRPNGLELFRDASVGFSLALIIVLTMVPFVGAGAVIGTALSVWSKDAGKVYAADLIGGGVAAALAVFGLMSIGALGVLVVTVMLTAVASILFAKSRQRTLIGVITLLAIATAAMLLVRDEDAWIKPAPTKELALVHRPEAGIDRVEHRAWTPHGRIDVTYAYDGPPLAAGDIAPPTPRAWRVRFVTQDGAAPTTMHRVARDPSELSFLPHSTTAAVWIARGAELGAKPSADVSTLVIGVGGGVDVMMALAHGSGRVDGIDVNGAIIALHTEHFRDFTRIADDKRVHLRVDEGRAFVRASPQRWDVIQLAGVDTFTALASGAYSLAEAYVYTLEAFEDYLAHLDTGGCLSVSRLILHPPRETLRLAVTAMRALENRGVRDPKKHIAIVRGTLWSTVLACVDPIDAPALDRLRGWAGAHPFLLVFDPARPGDSAFDNALAPDNAFIANYPYRITPATDEAPFFFDYFRWAAIGKLTEMQSGSVYASTVPIGHGVQLLTLLITALLAAFGILRPLRREGVALPKRRHVGLYFACLGAGFLFVEVGLIQRLTFFLGHPTNALAVVLAALLVSSGVGSALSERLSRRSLSTLIPALLMVAATASHWVLPTLVGMPLTSRVAIALVLVSLVGVALGMPFPQGLRELRDGREALIPWAFGVNAFVTVVAAAVAPLAALEVGFSVLFLAAAVVYIVALRLPISSLAISTQTE